MVRVPVTPAKWSTWKRYCETVGISIGRAIVTLTDRELADALGDSGGGVGSVLAHQAEEHMADREAKLASRETELGASEERIRRWSQLLRDRERELEVRERRVKTTTKLAAQPAKTWTKAGRNERCPCASGRKYKLCHGLRGR